MVDHVTLLLLLTGDRIVFGLVNLLLDYLVIREELIQFEIYVVTLKV